MTPERAEPLHMALHHGVAGKVAESITDVVPAHLAHSPEQIAGIIQHDPWAAALAEQLRNQIGKASITLREGFGIVIVSFSLMFKHELQMGDQRSVWSGWDGRLVHVQGTGETGADRFKIAIAVASPDRSIRLHEFQQLCFSAGERGVRREPRHGLIKGCDAAGS